ncbi:MAG: radical SAM protein, partial [Lachnospiraceae bacterium]|nr:radical SAM protein [Lachnospiraceae bacterium]
IGVAYTYNEALVGYEYVRDTAKLVREAGMLNVLVTNGTAELPVLMEILPYIDAMNIDLKGFTPEIYRYLGGDLETVKRFIARAAEACHVELTTLVVPGMNDDPEEMREEASWIAGIDPGIPLHITRYFPRYKMRRPPTDIESMRRLETVAREYLTRVRLGNV